MRDMYFAEFYRRGAKHGRWQFSAGPRSVCILDGRQMMASLKIKCAAECRMRGFDGYRIARGKMTVPSYITPHIIAVDEKSEAA